MIERKFKTEAEEMTVAIKNLVESPEALENMELYLSIHFSAWLEKYANTPAGLVSELKRFSEM